MEEATFHDMPTDLRGKLKQIIVCARAEFQHKKTRGLKTEPQVGKNRSQTAEI